MALFLSTDSGIHTNTNAAVERYCNNKPQRELVHVRTSLKMAQETSRAWWSQSDVQLSHQSAQPNNEPGRRLPEMNSAEQL